MVTPVRHRLLLLTDRTQTRGRALVDVVRDAVDGGARAVVLREKDLPPPARAELAVRLAAVLRPVDGTLLVASSPEPGADGVHLAAGDPFPTPPPEIVGRSCHRVTELPAAAAEGCSYATLSPIFASASKPGYGPPLGPAGLGDPPLPVYALGGVTASNAGRCLTGGAAGVAVMGAVMRADDPAAVVAALLDAITAGAPR
jgi:thiamine-phosphate pyrophosphorylase